MFLPQYLSSMPAKLIRLYRMALSNSCNSVNGPLRNFWYRAWFQTGRLLIMRSLQLRHGECTVNDKSSLQWRYFSKKNSSCLRTLTTIEREPTKMGLTVNEGKTEYMLSTSRDVCIRETDIWCEDLSKSAKRATLYLWKEQLSKLSCHDSSGFNFHWSNLITKIQKFLYLLNGPPLFSTSKNTFDIFLTLIN